MKTIAITITKKQDMTPRSMFLVKDGAVSKTYFKTEAQVVSYLELGFKVISWYDSMEAVCVHGTLYWRHVPEVELG